ncbi:MarR family winged helix-turn-helix transcriptional regulator [Azospirillum sp. B4]|uniref:MarR family winged helix-turn-helix transcriptional regulator n=1 Tax=Azospirillum sp. B4 TaxID=95605 RepID=UPI00034CD83D|nr:MarR family winged helix-turn-helix transcriptional regulator [Azospirillum sp. B4]
MPDTFPPPEPTQCNCTALRQASRRLTKFYDDALVATGLGTNQYAILSRLKRHGPRTIQELATMLVMDRSTLGHLLRPLEKRGLVRLTITAADRRRRVIVLTPEGEAVVAQALPLWAAAQQRFEHVFGSDNALTLRTILRQVEMADLSAQP